jgi:glycosyltransferase involved in cell wall biosynthesis
LRRKGLQTFAEAACYLPGVPFRLAGYPIEDKAVSRLMSVAPANLRYLGGIDDSRLLAELQAARVYAQLSLHEGFGMALAEAMACGCIPVVTACGALPEVVGESGLYVPPEDPQAAAAAIRRALFEPEMADYGAAARARIAAHFPISARITGLQQAIRAVMEEQ